MGEEPVDLEEDRQLAFSRRIDLADAYFETYEEEKAGHLYQLLFKEFEDMTMAEKIPFIENLNKRYAMFLRYAKHDMEEALIYYEKSITKDPSMRAVIRLAKAYKAAGEHKEAVKLFRKALKYKNKDNDACTDYLIGECYYGLGNIKKAKECLKRAVLLSRDHEGCPKRYCFEAEYTLGLIALGEGDKEKAGKHYETVIGIVQDRDYLDEEKLFTES
jgi:tetratricopeptide (TPR) repeat protein